MKSPIAIEMKRLDDATCVCCLNSKGMEMHTITTLFGNEYCLVYCPSCEHLVGSLNRK